MRHTCTILFRAGVALGLAVGAACPAEFAAYEVILARQPFGTPAVEQAPAGPATGTPPPESFVLGYKLTAITRDEDGLVRVGIVEQKTRKSYLLAPGVNEDGLFIGDVEMESGEAQLCKGDEKYWMSVFTGGLTSNHAVRAAATNQVPGKPPAEILPPLPPAPSPSAALPPSLHPRLTAPGLTNLSYAARKRLRDDLRRREAEVQQLAAAKMKATGRDAVPLSMPPPANSADEDLPSLLASAGATNRASLIALLAQIGYTNADTVVENEQSDF